MSLRQGKKSRKALVLWKARDKKKLLVSIFLARELGSLFSCRFRLYSRNKPHRPRVPATS